MEENRIEENLAEAGAEELISHGEDVTCEETDPVGENGRDEREEYELLVKNRFKDFYAEDTQRLINRRFRKYKVMEERFKLMEEELSARDAKISDYETKIADFDAFLQVEIERAVREAEERLIGEIKAKRLRPSENGAAPTKAAASFDVSRLTKSERATLAKRAAGGEKIKF